MGTSEGYSPARDGETPFGRMREEEDWEGTGDDIGKQNADKSDMRR